MSSQAVMARFRDSVCCPCSTAFWLFQLWEVRRQRVAAEMEEFRRDREARRQAA